VLVKMLVRSVLLGAAVGGPMLFFRASDVWNGARRTLAALTTAPADEPASAPDGSAPVPPVAPAPIASKSPIDSPPVRTLEEVLRFDVSPRWVMDQWARVSTGMAQLQLQGYRVLLVTGTGRDDLAGSLTYYFNPHQQLQKITFNGTTGDATKLVRLLVTRYRFVLRLTNDGGLFVYEGPSVEGEGVRSVLRIRPSGVVKADEPHQRFHVDLMLERPEPLAPSSPRRGFGLAGG